MKKLIPILFVSAIALTSNAKDNFRFQCQQKKQAKGNHVALEVTGTFEFSKEEPGLSGKSAEVEATFNIDAQLNGRPFYKKTKTLDDAYYNNSDGDDLAFSETIKGQSKKISFEYLFIEKNNGQLNIKIDDVTQDYEHLDCKAK